MGKRHLEGRWEEAIFWLPLLLLPDRSLRNTHNSDRGFKTYTQNLPISLQLCLFWIYSHTHTHSTERQHIQILFKFFHLEAKQTRLASWLLANSHEQVKLRDCDPHLNLHHLWTAQIKGQAPPNLSSHLDSSSCKTFPNWIHFSSNAFLTPNVKVFKTSVSIAAVTLTANCFSSGVIWTCQNHFPVS